MHGGDLVKHPGWIDRSVRWASSATSTPLAMPPFGAPGTTRPTRNPALVNAAGYTLAMVGETHRVIGGAAGAAVPAQRGALLPTAGRVRNTLDILHSRPPGARRAGRAGGRS